MRRSRRIPHACYGWAYIFLGIMVLQAGAEEPKRIVSLAPSMTENLYSLGMADQIIAVTSYCRSPLEEKVGNLTNPNIEQIFSLSPDLVVAVKGINRPQTLSKLKNLGLNVIVFENADNFTDIEHGFIRLGRLLDKEKEAKDILRKTEEELDSLTSKLKTQPPVRVFWEVGSKPLVTAGRGTFANEFITRAGGVNIFEDTDMPYPRVSREEVLRRNPEVIILVTMGNVTEKEKTYWQKFKDLDAVKKDRIHIIDAQRACVPTPVSFLLTLKKVAALLHPEVF